MNRIQYLVLSIGLCALPAVTAFAQDHGLPGPAQGVLPVVAQAGNSSPGPAPNAIFEAPLGFEISLQHHEELKHATPPPFLLGGSQIIIDPNSGQTDPPGDPLFSGPTPNGWIPYDAAVAVGPSHVVAMANAKWVAYDKTNPTSSVEHSFDSWWGTSAGTPFDPKCYYDSSGHFVMIATSVANNGKANMYVSVSQTNNPTGLWWSYTFDWRLDGTTATKNWGDYPGLGYNDTAIFINTNQYGIRGGQFKYSKVRVLDKSQLFSGSPGNYTDFTNLKNGDNTAAFTVKPARSLSSTGTSEYLLNTRAGGGSSVTLWRIDNAPTSPTITRVATVGVGSYGVPPDAPQLGGSNLVATGDCRTQDIVWRDGNVYTAFSESISSRSALRYLSISSTGTVNMNGDLSLAGGTGIHLYYPAVTADGAGNLFMVFNRSSSSQYISMYSTTWPVGGTFGASVLGVAGTTYMNQSRWGDYNAIHNDGASGIWGMAGTARSNVWTTDILQLQ